MKKVLLFAVLAATFASCSNSASTEEESTTDTTVVKVVDSVSVKNAVDSVK